MKKKVAIIGSGIAGLSAGYYLQTNGYETEIYEMHDKPGGLCTSWARKGYTFDFCVEWLLGSGPGNNFYKIWNEIIDLKKMICHNHSIMYSYDLENSDKYGNKIFHLYSKISRMKEYLLDIAPEDKAVIKDFIGCIEGLKTFRFPPLIEKAPMVRTWLDNLQFIFYLPLVLFLKKWSKISNFDLAKRCKNPFLKEAFLKIYAGKNQAITNFAMRASQADQDSAGYPIGGSLNFSREIEKNYLRSGGTIHYKTPVSKIITKKNLVRGIKIINGNIINSDIVVSACDGYFTLFKALGGKYLTSQLKKIYNHEVFTIFESLLSVGLGINRKMDELAHRRRIKLDTPLLLPDGTQINYFPVEIYNYDDRMAPKGKSVLKVMLMTRNDQYWSDMRSENQQQYEETKMKVAHQVIDVLDQKIGKIKNFIEVIDVATPDTVKRYTNNWRGSYEGWYPPEDFLTAKSIGNEIPGLKNFYHVGHWVEPGGGLPVALTSGRYTAELICKRDKKKFITKFLNRADWKNPDTSDQPAIAEFKPEKQKVQP